VEVDAEMQGLVERLLASGIDGKHAPSRKQLTDTGLKKVNLKVAVERLQGQLPADVASLVHRSVEGKSKQPFAEESIEKGRKVLNELIEKSWVELDDKNVQCHEFYWRNRGTYDQVVTDIARLAETIADLNRIKAESIEGIAVKEQEIIQVTALLKKETEVYLKILFENRREMTIRKNDQAVFEFMMKTTKCKGSSFAQLGEDGDRPRAQICDTQQGLELRFDDPKIQEEMERKMTPGAKEAIRSLLASVQAGEAKQAAADLVEEAAKVRKVDEIDEDGNDAGKEAKQRAELSALGVKEEPTSVESPTVTTTTMMVPTPAIEKVKVVKRPDTQKVCTGSRPPECWLLHDKMSLLWGKYKDLVDELQEEMDKNEFEFNELESNLNEQLDVLRNTKARYITELNEAIANLNAATEEMTEKTSEKRTLTKEYTEYRAACRKRIEYLMFQEICAYLKIRASITVYSKIFPPEKIIDCEVTDYIRGECSVSCDDTCPEPNDPYACGGWAVMTRDIIVPSNEFGYKCPALSRKVKCSQFKCAVDCLQSKWSGWGSCSKDCMGGVRARTRSIIVTPKNGGMACNTVSESEPCGGPCDVNCRLKRWSKWSPCSVACGGGFQEKWRRVTVPTKGQGRCPKTKSRFRYRLKKCNTHDCMGDEICVATQDLVLSIDGSGSLREAGFKTLKTFAAKLMDKYQGQYYGEEDMRIGVVQFGNGEVEADGTIAEAKHIIDLTSDIKKVQAALEGMEFLKGFTNMAQAFSLAEKVILLGGRKRAQPAVMTLTDGKPSFLFQTHEKVMQLKDKHVKLFFVPVVESEGEELALMKSWASQPWETHLVHVKGLDPLAADGDVFAQKIIVEFCPEAMSPSAMQVEEIEMGYMLVRENGSCGPRGEMLSRDVTGVADCAALAQGAGVTAFSLGIRYARGRCYAEGLKVTKEMVDGFKKNRASPACTEGDWKKDALYDFYVMFVL